MGYYYAFPSAYLYDILVKTFGLLGRNNHDLYKLLHQVIEWLISMKNVDIWNGFYYDSMI